MPAEPTLPNLVMNDFRSSERIRRWVRQSLCPFCIGVVTGAVLVLLVFYHLTP